MGSTKRYSHLGSNGRGAALLSNEIKNWLRSKTVSILWDKAVSRDYYIAANSDGGLYWIFETASMNTGIRKAYLPDSSWSGQPQQDNNNG